MSKFKKKGDSWDKCQEKLLSLQRKMRVRGVAQPG